ncbi:MAG TPA: hypothetical protein VFN41_14475, partial [Candidatus Limnocylindrales bacterium]|nr:hypothetical protein [Candidatus Limnocylindrales bacterium]
MFLHAALTRNRRLVDHAIDAVRSGAIRPGTFVVDVDTVVGNAELLRDAAAAVDLRLHFMTKQIGRQPAVIRA